MRITRLGGARARFELVLEWRDGPVVVYQHSEGSPRLLPFGVDRGRAAGDPGERSEGERALPLPARARGARAASPRAEQAVLDDFLEALRTGSAPGLSAEDNLLTVATVEAAIRANALGRPVTLSEIGDAAGVRLGAPLRVVHG